MISEEKLAEYYAITKTLGLFQQSFETFKKQFYDNYYKALNKS